MSQSPYPAPATASHPWTFFRIGGLDQVSLETGADLLNLEHLDQKLWVALSCPTKGLEIDARTLELLDQDKDGRVRVPEIVAAIKWSAARLRDVGQLIRGGDTLALSALNDQTPEGQAALASAKQILANLGKSNATSIAVADVADTARIFAQTKFNGDGIVPAEAADTPELQQVVQDIIACLGPETDRSAKPGVNQAKLDQFYADAAAFAAWSKQGAAPEVVPLGPATAAAAAALQAIRVKVDDYFARCRLAAFDARATGILNRADTEFAGLAAKDLSADGAEVAGFPLARIEPGKPLPLLEGTNPAWVKALAAFHRDAVVPVFGATKASLSADEWTALKTKLAPHEAWLAAKAGASVEKLGLPRVNAILAGPGKAGIEALLAKDKALEPQALAVGEVERLLRYQRDLYRLLRNFVSFLDFYDPRIPAVFQTGTLYLDSRSCDLCIRVDDPGAHATLGSLSKMYIAYCDCRRPGGEAMKIAACFTQGDSDYLMVGRNGVFYDRKGRDWDATIIKIVDNPISIRQAFFAPYKKFVRMIEEQVMKAAAAKEKAADDRLAAAAASTTQTAAGAKPPTKPDAVDVGKMVGIIAALGVGAGALGTVFGGLVSGFFKLEPWWAKLLAVVGVLLLISGPSMLIAWLKLRQRTLGPVLDANGWAVNGRVKINIPFGTALTGRAILPSGSTRSLEDPYEDKEASKRRRLIWVLVILIALAWAGWKLFGNSSADKAAEPASTKPAAAAPAAPEATK